MSILNGLSDEERRGYLFAHVYARERQKRQKFYKPWPDEAEFKDHPVFKACVTVTKWLEDQKLHVAWSDSTWQAYIEFVFIKLTPTIPQPGQLKNPVILKEYLKSCPDLEVKEIKTSKLEALYRKVLRKELLDDPGLMEMLGFRNIDPTEDD